MAAILPFSKGIAYTQTNTSTVLEQYSDIEQRINSLSKEQRNEEMIPLLESTLSRLKAEIQVAGNNTANRDRLYNKYCQFALALEQSYFAVTQDSSLSKKGETGWAQRHSKALVGLARDIEEFNTQNPDLNDMQLSANFFYKASLAELQLRNYKQTDEYIHNAITMTQTMSSDANWLKEYNLYRYNFIRLYAANKGTGKQFYADLENLINNYKETNWACRASLEMTTAIPGFYGETDDLNLYVYYSFLANMLDENQRDPSMERLYYELCAISFRLDFASNAVSWCTAFLKRFPTSHYSDAVNAILQKYETVPLEKEAINVSSRAGSKSRVVQGTSASSSNSPQPIRSPEILPNNKGEGEQALKKSGYWVGSLALAGVVFFIIAFSRNRFFSKSKHQ
jgi:hypothetical protein